MFPIIDHRGNVIGFGGRSLEKDAHAKYLNTAENMVFKKGENVYAMNFAKDSKDGFIILCEGYMDVISLHQAGFTNAIATLGTALTPKQANLIKRYSQSVVVCYDSDEAGKKATKRALDILAIAGLGVKVVTVSGGKDPDELMKTENGPQIFRRLVQASSNSMDYKLEDIKSSYSLSAESEKVQCIQKMLDVLAAVPSPVEQAIYIDKISKDLDVPKEVLMSELKIKIKKIQKIKSQKQKKELYSSLEDRNDRINTQRPKYLKAARIEEDILSIIINYPEKLDKVEKAVSEADFVTDFNRRVFCALSEKIKSNPTDDAMLSLPQYFNPDEISHINSYLLRVEALSVSDESIYNLAEELKEEKRINIQKNFNTDESFEARLESMRERKQNGSKR